MDHFAMLTPHEQLVETVLHKGKWKFYQELMELSLDHKKFLVDHLENHWYKLGNSEVLYFAAHCVQISLFVW